MSDKYDSGRVWNQCRDGISQSASRPECIQATPAHADSHAIITRWAGCTGAGDDEHQSGVLPAGEMAVAEIGWSDIPGGVPLSVWTLCNAD